MPISSVSRLLVSYERTFRLECFEIWFPELEADNFHFLSCEDVLRSAIASSSIVKIGGFMICLY